MIKDNSYYPNYETRQQAVEELNRYLTQLYSVTYSSILQSVNNPQSLTPDMSENNIQYMAFEKLVSDGFAYVKPMSKSRSYIISYDGIQFLANGGYTSIDSPKQQLLNEQLATVKAQRNFNIITLIISVIAVVVAFAS